MKNELNNLIRRNILSIIFFVLFLLFFFALHYNSFNTPFERDEGEYAYSAWLMQQHQPFYVHSFLQKPPLIIYTYYLAQIIKPFALWPPRLLGFIFTLISCLLLALIANKVYGRKTAWFTLFISPLLLSFSPLCALAANTEKFMLLPLIALLALFIFKRNKETRLVYFLAGVLSALAIFYKPLAFPPSAIIIIYWLGFKFLIERDSKKTFKSFLDIILGVVLVTFLVFLYPLLNGALGEFWKQVITFNLSYASDMKKYFPGQFFHYAGVFFKNLWPIILLVIASVFLRPKYISLWVTLFLFSLLVIITTPIGHYYLLITPFLILLAAGSFSKLEEIISAKTIEVKNIIYFSFGLLIAIVYFSSLGEQLVLSPSELSAWVYGTNAPFIESSLMAQKIKEQTQADQKIFIAGSEPQIYYFSERESVSKFDITYPLNINTSGREDYQTKVVSDLKNNQAAAIVVSLGKDSGLWEKGSPRIFVDYLTRELESNYHLVGGTKLNILMEPIWLNSKNISSQDNPSLLLYVRNK